MKILAAILFSIVLTDLLIHYGITFDAHPISFIAVTVVALGAFIRILFWAEGKRK